MVTIRDVAKYLGVSVSTVSRCLNHHPDINEETRLRVETAMKELNYVPNSAARSVSKRCTNTIGLTIPDIQDSYFAENASGVEDVLQKHGYTLVYGSMARDPGRMIEFVQYAREMRFDGLIITPEVWSEELLELLGKVDIPVVALRRRPPANAGIPYVDGDHYTGAQQMVEYLYGIGHRDIAHIVLNTDIGRERFRGYRDAMNSHGLEPRSILVETPANRTMDAVRNGHEAMRRLRKAEPEVTAVFASSDPIGVGAMEYLAENGLRVPEDISVCGSGDIDFCSLYWFRMTTIAFERYELGRKAAQMLLKMISREVKHPKSVLSETHLVVRGSTRNITLP